MNLIPLGEVASCQYGLSEKADPAGERLYVGMGQLKDGRVVSENANKLTVSTDVARKFGLKVGDVLFNRTNSLDLVGKTAIVEDYSLEGAVFASYLVRLNVDPSKYESRFLNIWMNSKGSVERLRRMATPGVSQFNIRPSLLSEKFLVPDVDIGFQRKIICIEAEFEKRLALLRQAIKAKREYKRGLTQQLLTGKRRFPEFVSKDQTQEGVFSSLPLDWKIVHIGDVAKESANRGEKDGAIVYSCTKHDGLVPSLEYFGKQVFSRNLDAYKRLHVGDFAYATNHIEEGSIGLLRKGQKPGLVSPMYTVFHCSVAVDPEYLFAVLKTESYRRIFESRMSASVDRRGSLRWKEFAKIRVPLPSLKEQKEIVKVLNLLDSEISILEKQKELIQQYKRVLLGRLLSGDICVAE